jgi:hypothetical protein
MEKDDTRYPMPTDPITFSKYCPLNLKISNLWSLFIYILIRFVFFFKKKSGTTKKMGKQKTIE